MADELTKELQTHLLKMFKWFHEFCETHGLRYYALGGTMLGAARHKGFIPWDDDMDVGMPRKDYNELICLIGNKTEQGYFLETPLSPSKEYRYPYSKLYDTRTTLTERTWPVLKRGVFIDVFPLDGLGNTLEESQKKWKKLAALAGFEMARSCALRKNRELYKNVSIIAAHCLPGFIANDKKVLKKTEDICNTLDYDTSMYGGNAFGFWGLREIMPLSVMGKPTLYQFEDTKIYGVEDFDAYLTSLYGEWRKLPPIERQVSHHEFLEFDLNKGFR